MDLTHSPRHTRRGFLRGDASPKFFPLSKPIDEPVPQVDDIDFRPPASEPSHTIAVQAFPAPPQLSKPNVPLGIAGVPESEPPDIPHLRRLSLRPAAPAPAAPQTQTTFEPEYDSPALSAIEESLAAPGGNAFLSWLAEQLEGKTNDDFDPYVESTDLALLGWYDDECDVIEGFEFEAAYAEDDDEEVPEAQPTSLWQRREPRIEMSPDGWRVEIFEGGSKIVKDVLGRVVEVHSYLGETMQFRYGENGLIEGFQRIRTDGTNHSEGARDKHGVVVRDPEGRVRAAGESMTIDPRGSFFLHTFDGQFFSIDLVTGIHAERRKLTDETGASRFVTSLFARDGFRMATMFSGCKGSTAYGARSRTPKFRFYGRDGSLIEFASEDDLQDLRPQKVLRPAARKISKTWPHIRQAQTAWDAVRDYLMRVG
jgi:hypothetical protein